MVITLRHLRMRPGASLVCQLIHQKFLAHHSTVKGVHCRIVRSIGKVLAAAYFFAGAAGGALTLLESHAKPSRRPSPVVAQLGTTYQTLSFSLDRCRASVTSWGFIAVGSLLVRLVQVV